MWLVRRSTLPRTSTRGGDCMDIALTIGIKDECGGNIKAIKLNARSTKDVWSPSIAGQSPCLAVGDLPNETLLYCG